MNQAARLGAPVGAEEARAVPARRQESASRQVGRMALYVLAALLVVWTLLPIYLIAVASLSTVS